MRTSLIALFIAILAATGATAPVAAATRVPKVAVVVGPAGSVTARYRALADSAAEVARKAGAEVVTVYSPNATWPRVRQAVEGASIVVYLGHGNGWPSPHRDALYPATQNGFGLNPVAGGDNRTHQYFGEKYISGLNLAHNAVVVFSHLCYASCNSEPGVPEGSGAQAVERVDNYAAGFLRAGAGAVVAEAYLGPAYYVSALLKGRGTVEDIFAAAPSANGRTFAVHSVRSPGYAVHLDPDRADGGYVRSLVSKGVTAAQLRAGARGVVGRGGDAREPTLARTGVRFGEPSFRFLPIAGTTTRLTLPLAAGKVARIPARTELSVRWDPIVLDPAPGDAPATPVASPVPSAFPSPAPSPSGPLATTPSPEPSDAPVAEAPPVDLVVPEQQGSVVEPARASISPAGLWLDVRYPAAPGLYRLNLMLHTPEGVAYDAATQELLTPVLVRVSGPFAVAYGAPTAVTLSAGQDALLPVRVMNAGSERWDSVVIVSGPPVRITGEAERFDRTMTLPAHLAASWVSADAQTVPEPVSIAVDAVASQPGGAAETVLQLTAPATPGNYLLLLDVVSPVKGAMSALGTAPAIVRVTVVPASTPAPTLEAPQSQN